MHVVDYPSITQYLHNRWTGHNHIQSNLGNSFSVAIFPGDDLTAGTYTHMLVEVYACVNFER